MAATVFVRSLRSINHTSSLNQNLYRSAITRTRTGIRCFSTVEVSEFEGDELHDTIKATEKVTALHLALSRLAGDFCNESRLSLQRFFDARRWPAISTGSLKLDLALGIGGLPKGRIVEIYGREASGKTMLALHVIKEAQNFGGYCAYLDVENALDPMLAESIGVNTEDLLISQPDCAENLLSMVDTLTKSGSVNVIVVDSVAALLPQRDIDLVIGEISSKDQGFSRGGKEVTCGGNALPFYSAVRLRLIRKGVLRTNDKITGLGICVEVVKNKLAPALKTAELSIKFGRGIDCAPEILELGCEQGIILVDGDTYLIDGEVLHSKEDAENYLDQNDTIREKVVKNIRSQLFPEKRVKENN